MIRPLRVMLATGPLLLGLVACTPNDTVETASAGAGANPSPTAPTTPAPLSASSLAEIGRAGTTITPTDAKASPPAVSLANAQKLAAASFTAVRSAVPAEALYGMVTNTRSGVRPTGDTPASASTTFRPSISNRPMWLLLYHDIKLPVMSSYGSDKPLYQSGDFLVCVDSTTGEIPRAQTVQ
jgi:hypothetical protein